MPTATQLRTHGRRAAGAAVGVLVVLALAATPASAGVVPQLLPLLGGDDSGDGGGGGSATTSSTTPAPPAGEFSIEAELLDGGTQRASSTASEDAFLRTLGTVVQAPLEAGTKEIIIRAKAVKPSRLVITVGGEIVAGYNVRTGWRTFRTVVHVADSAPVLGVAHEARPGIDEARKIDLDWISVDAHAPGYTTAGDQILAPDGTPVVPRGLTMPGYQAANEVDGRLSVPPSFADEQHVWGAELVRIPMNQEHWLADCASTKDGVWLSYRAAISDEVRELTSRGIMVMLTLTRTERGKATGCAPASRPVFKEMPDRRTPRFWRQVASRFADNPLVGFDLYNEPHSITDRVWRNGGTITYTDTRSGTPTEATYEAVGMQALINAVRSTGADNLIYVSGSRWAANPGVAIRQPIDGYGLVLASHTYCHDCSPPMLNARLDTVTDEVGSRYPLIVSETGWIDSRSGEYARLFVDWAKARGLGWTIYAWGHPDADYSVLSSWVHNPYPIGGGVTMKPSPAGTPVWNELADVRVSRGYDAHLLPE